MQLRILAEMVYGIGPPGPPGATRDSTSIRKLLAAEEAGILDRVGMSMTYVDTAGMWRQTGG
jgi:hypothetical protein